ncbi:MAG: hypothetical protein JW889_10370 [Verrucomicrobia bacterium]|nr:hypothetical protein [Verrucomicrobiota bacterium]
MRRRKQTIQTGAILAALLALPALLVLVAPGPNTVSAAVYSNEVGFIKAETKDNGATLVSVPLTLLGESPYYGLNNETLDGPAPIGEMLAADLVGATTFPNADKVMYFDGTNYRTAWLYYNSGNPDDPYNNLWLEGLAVSDLTLEPENGFWVVRANASDPDTVTFLGEVRSDPSVEVTFGIGWRTFSWPYPTTESIQTSSLFADGAYPGATFNDADRVGAYSVATGYEWSWLYTDGTWYTGANPSTLTLDPQRGYWYYRQAAAGGPFTWTCTKPY